MIWIYRLLGIVGGMLYGIVWAYSFYMSMNKLEWPKSNYDKVEVRADGVYMGGFMAAVAVIIVNQTAQSSLYKPPDFGLSIPIQIIIGILCAVVSALLGVATFLAAYYSVNKRSYWDEQDKKRYKAKSTITRGTLEYFVAFIFILFSVGIF